MFVRITRGAVDAIYECSEARIVPQKNPDQILITMEQLGTPDGRSIIVDKACPEALGIYYMNAHGKTIDVIFRKGFDEIPLIVGSLVFIHNNQWLNTTVEEIDDSKRRGCIATLVHENDKVYIPLGEIEWNSAKGRWEHYRSKYEEK